MKGYLRVLALSLTLTFIVFMKFISAYKNRKTATHTPLKVRSLNSRLIVKEQDILVDGTNGTELSANHKLQIYNFTTLKYIKPEFQTNSTEDSKSGLLGANLTKTYFHSELRSASLKPLSQFNRNVLLYTALISNTTGNSTWDRLAIQGWEHRKFGNEIYECCVKFETGRVKKFRVSAKITRVYRVPMEAKQFIVNLTGSHSDDLPLSTILIRNGEACPREDEMYVKIEYVYRFPGEIAIFAKVIYGNASASDLLAWFELHSLLGFSKAVFYCFRLSQNVSRVLHYYRQKGKVEIVPFAFPDYKYERVNMRQMVRGFQHFNDEDVALLDAQERLQGYKYVVSFDIDEFILPTKSETWMSLFDRLCSKHPDAAGFTFGTYLYTTSWGTTSNSSIFTVGRYLNRTGLTEDCVKHFTIPSRMETGTLNTHHFKPKPGFKAYPVPETEGSLRHYRACRGGYKKTNTKCFEFKRFSDDTVYKMFKTIETDVLEIKNRLEV